MTVYISYKNATVRKNWSFRRIDINKTRASKECMLCHYWYFIDVGYKFEPHFCNKCLDVLMTVYELKNNAIKKNVKKVDYSCIFWGISKIEVVDILNTSVLEVKGVFKMDFGVQKVMERIWSVEKYWSEVLLLKLLCYC